MLVYMLSVVVDTAGVASLATERLVYHHHGHHQRALLFLEAAVWLYSVPMSSSAIASSMHVIR